MVKIFFTAKFVMLHRLLLLLLIGTTLLGPAVCCCTLRLTNTATSEPSCCCCSSDDSPESCPLSSDSDHRHECPCRKHLALAAKLDDSQMPLTSPAVKWMLELSQICSSSLFVSTDDGLLQRKKLPPDRFDSMLTGTQILIAHSVRRC